MAQDDKKPKFSREKESIKPAKFNVDKKIETIKASNMPEKQKEEYIRSLQGPGEKDEGVTLGVYFRIKSIEKTKADAMKFYPKAVGVNVATISGWDKIFSDF